MNRWLFITLGVVASSLLVAACSMGVSETRPVALESPSMMGPTDRNPSLEEYMNIVGPTAQKIPHGQLKLDGHPVSCGTRPTVMNSELDSWGGAFPGYVILNPSRLEGLSTPVKFYVYHHECGHQFIGASETKADCYSIRNGVKRGWLDANGMNDICTFISKLKGDRVHPPGTERCKLMRQCYAEALGQQRASR
ncbi:hypothetical protein A7A08_02837 [Methyloligella halotolerans]|uniref:Lipoprotein n=1 Tax=Methyloligella halotolerans TaxID=1177755 RepID=A0A1E2RVP1_9HYPH|nr:hypothetical protein [Methyloligella halotolerans]ODA66190.1 hypothetical protein A7A08_02837 [Methyloligella halotolerans]